MKRKTTLCILFGTPAPVLRIAEACLRFTPKIAVRDPLHDDENASENTLRTGAIFLDLELDQPAPGQVEKPPPASSQPSKIFPPTALLPMSGSMVGPEESVLARIRAICARFQSSPRFAFGDDPAMALARARLQDLSRSEPAHCVPRPTALDALPLGALQDYARPFAEDAEVRKQVTELIRMLQWVGFSTVGDFLKLPERSLASRFGRESLLLALRIRSASQWIWPAFKPPERIRERIDLQDAETQGSCVSLESLLFILRASLDRCMARLRGRALRASRIKIRLKLDRYGPTTANSDARAWDIALPVPQGSALGILPLLRDRLDFDLGRDPLRRPAVVIELEITETAPGHGAQRDFFDAREREAEDWDALVGRLSQKIGREGAFVAESVDRHLPEKSWKPVIQSSFDGSAGKTGGAEEVPPRPSRILKFPELVRINANELLHPAKQKKWTIVRIHGPERLAAEWWDPQSRDRDYYRVMTGSGQDLWIFTQVDQGMQVFLHGYFD